MSATLPQDRLNVVFCWHMHQPEYRDLLTGQYRQPWSYLHAIKDYTDMAAHLEAYPAISAVVNFAPILLEEIEDYGLQLDWFLRDQKPVSDPLLAALAGDVLPIAATDRVQLAQSCLRANEQRIINRFEPYRRLVEIVRSREHKSPVVDYLNDQFFHDLLVWYHLAWLGETVRRGDARVRRLMDKGRQYDRADRHELVEVLRDTLKQVIPSYRRLAEIGQIELSMSPYAHPMMPLLIDFSAARESVPDVSLPQEPYPGGTERVRWHLEAGVASFQNAFDRRPAGCWPSEGGISDSLLPLLVEYEFQWIASGQGVLGNSLKRSHEDIPDGPWPYRPYRLGNFPIYGFFRDDGLSDAIGFNYSDWHGEDAVADLVHHLEKIRSRLEKPAAHVVSIIMDGENAWEHYPENGAYFLDHLYTALSDHPQLKTTTYSEFLAQHAADAAELPHICAGSWVYGNFSTWIGDPDKNRAWDILIKSKQTYDDVVSNQSLPAQKREQLERQLAICEGSDWFWWFGDYNPVASIEDFSDLYRRHISNLHKMLGRPVPAGLDGAFGRGGAAEHGGAMRRGSAG